MFSHGILKSKVCEDVDSETIIFPQFGVCLFAASHSQAMPIIANLLIYRLVALKWYEIHVF